MIRHALDTHSASQNEFFNEIFFAEKRLESSEKTQNKFEFFIRVRGESREKLYSIYFFLTKFNLLAKSFLPSCHGAGDKEQRRLGNKRFENTN